MENKEIPLPKNYEILRIENKAVSFLVRLWRLVSNPFTYLFTGKIRY